MNWVAGTVGAGEAGAPPGCIAWFDNLYAVGSSAFATTSAYANYPSLALVDFGTSYFGSNYPRLQSIKTQLNPTNVFQYPQAVVPSVSSATATITRQPTNTATTTAPASNSASGTRASSASPSRTPSVVVANIRVLFDDVNSAPTDDFSVAAQHAAPAALAMLQTLVAQSYPANTPTVSLSQQTVSLVPRTTPGVTGTQLSFNALATLAFPGQTPTPGATPTASFIASQTMTATRPPTQTATASPSSVGGGAYPVSPNGMCGPHSGSPTYRCAPSFCCSAYGYCGTSAAHCSNCQAAFGIAC